MNRFISIPRQALAELLQAAGSPLTPEQYLASLPESGVYAKYRGRARVAAWSKYILLAAVIVSGAWMCLPIGFCFESVLITLILAGITFFEYRVHRYFIELNPEAPILGFRNQAVFAIVILIYGLYHAWASGRTPTSIEVNNLLDPESMEQFRVLVRIFYLLIGIVGCISQFGQAWYYRAARVAKSA